MISAIRRLWRRIIGQDTVLPGASRWRMFFDMQHPEKRRIDLGVFEGSAAEAVEACYEAQMGWAFDFMARAPEPNMAVMGNYGIEEIKDEPAAAQDA